MTRYLDVPDGRIAYDDAGVGPLVVCMPGLGDVRGEYRFLTPLLVRAGYRVVTMDIRGHGETSVRWPDYSVAGMGGDVLALVRALGAGPAILVGASKSAGTAVWAAAEAPELVSRLVLIAPFVRDTGSAWLAHLLAYGLFGKPWGVGFWIRYLRTLYPSRQPDDLDVYFAYLRANLSERGRFAATRRMLTSSGAASDVRLGRVAAPVLLIMGTNDRDFKDPAAEAQLIASRMNAPTTIRLVEGAGHYPHAEMPDETASIVLDFTSGAERLRYGA